MKTILERIDFGNEASDDVEYEDPKQYFVSLPELESLYDYVWRNEMHQLTDTHLSQTFKIAFSTCNTTWNKIMSRKIVCHLVVAISVIAFMGCSDPVSHTTDAPTDTVITISAISGVTVPAIETTPATSITENEQYTGTISWSPEVNGTFAASTVYTTTISLTEKPGYTLKGVVFNFFKVAGATNTWHSTNSGVINAYFPRTLGAPVSDGSSVNIGILKAVQGGNFNHESAIDSSVSSFRISQHEITGEQYAAVMGVADPSYFASIPNNPVESVTWFDAVEFCNKLSALEGLTEVYTINGRMPAAGYPITNATVSANWSANGYRLPTDAEWQFAAQGGNDTNHYTYAGSNTIDNVAWMTTNSGNTTHSVGGKISNELGLYDLSGNVEEWCWDWYDLYPSSILLDYRGADSGMYRITRGGNWYSTEQFCDVADQHVAYPYYQSSKVGFRVVRP